MSDQMPNDLHQPDPDTTFTYDVYLSYSDADQHWVHTALLPRLEAEGVRVCIGERDFRLGVPRMTEQERAVLTSRKTLVILSPDFLASGWTAFDRVLQQTLDAESREYRLIPLLKEPCELPPSLRYLTAANFVDPSDSTAEWTRLIKMLRTALPAQPPPPIPVLSIPAPAPLPAGSRMPLSYNPVFVGREEELRELAQVLKAGNTAAIGQIAAATGLGGIGKTQLAAEFVHRYGQYFKGGVFWLSFADPAAVPAEMATCGGDRGMRLHAAFDQLSLDKQVQLVLAEWHSALPRLLVFDNCEDEVLLDQWRPKHGGCRVLVTTRRAEWDMTFGVHALPLAVLPRAESIALLGSFRPDLAQDDTDLDAIAAELGDLPLALHLAGSFLKRYHSDMTVGEYLDELRAVPPIAHESLEGTGISPTKHDLSVARTFRLSYDRLDPATPLDALALSILVRTTYFAPGESIPRDLLRATLELSADARYTKRHVTQGMRRLVDLGLLEEDVEGAMRVHRLVAAFVRVVAPNGVAQTVVEQTMFDRAKELNAQGYPAPLLALQPHLRAITNAALERQDTQAADLGNELAYHLQAIGAYRAAQGYYEQALVIHQRVLGPDHPDTATSLNNLGRMLRVQGKYAEAQRAFAQALAIRQQILGPDHPDTATSLNDLGEVLRARTQYQAAQRYLEEALAIRQRVLGTEHPDTAMSFFYLGWALLQKGQYQAARRNLEQALTIRQRVLGPNHPDIARSLNGLGCLLQDQGQYQAAQGYLEQGLAIRQRVLGPEHPDTATSISNLGRVFLQQGHYQAAQRNLEQGLAICQRVLSPDHPKIAWSLNCLGEVLQAQERYTEAQGYLGSALTIRQKVLGSDHPDTVWSLNNLGCVLRAQGQYVEAQHYLAQALDSVQRVLGLDHSITASILNSLGSVLGARGQYAEAQRYVRQALDIRQRVLGPDHPDTAGSLNNLGFVLQDQGQYANAQHYYQQALAIWERVLGADHPNTRMARQRLASSMDQQHEPEGQQS